MNRTLYTVLFYLALPLIFARLLWRSIKAPAYRLRWGERLGLYGDNKVSTSSNIIFHAVSVGEVHAAVPLIRRVQAQFPDRQIIITTSTPTGSTRVSAIFADTVKHVYLPYDLPGAVNRFLSFARADLLVILETELWPNLIHACQNQGEGQNVKVIMANARLSEKSLRSYQKVASLSSQMLSELELVAAQSKADGDRFLSLGLKAESLQITGSMKFDLDLDTNLLKAGKALKQDFDTRPVIAVGSTREGEEEKVLDAFLQILKNKPDALLILIPRHPERFKSVSKLLQAKNLTTVTRSSKQQVTAQTQVLLGDSMGEMPLYYSAADVAFVGGSLVNTGCQNIIEPAALGLPVITGPSLFNFKAVSQILIEAGAMQVVQNPQELAEAVLGLFTDKPALEEMGLAAHKAVEVNKGATEKLVSAIERVLSN